MGEVIVDGPFGCPPPPSVRLCQFYLQLLQFFDAADIIVSRHQTSYRGVIVSELPEIILEDQPQGEPCRILQARFSAPANFGLERSCKYCASGPASHRFFLVADLWHCQRHFEP